MVDLSNPSTGTTLIDLSTTGNGGQVGMVGDVNGDGLGDLGLGASPALGVILFGRREFPPSVDIAAELSTGRAARVSIPGAFGRFLFTPAGDIDGDGIGDLAIGVPSRTMGPDRGEGEVILLGGRRAWPAEIDLTRPEAVLGRLRGGPGEVLASVLSGAGDINGDGRPDLLAATRTPRRAYLIFGPQAAPGDRLISEYIVRRRRGLRPRGGTDR